MAEMASTERIRLVESGRRLQYITIAWNSLEALGALISGFLAGSVALIGFGFDSLIEVTSGAAVLWRLHQDRIVQRREAADRLALRVVGSCFLALSIYVAFDSLHSLVEKEAPARSVPGIVIAAASLIAMPMLARAKRRIGIGLGSAAIAADARQTDFCTYLSGILLGGLLLNALLGMWWADPLAGLAMVPIIAKEGIAGWQGKKCCDACQ
jgi:divalent metal cation (Fe/Co/Zn/Cd) transporter